MRAAWVGRAIGRGWLVTLFASALAIALYLYVTGPGLAGTADTYHYISAAYSLQQTGHLALADGGEYRWWPPLFAVVLHIIGAADAVRCLNGLALVGSLAAWSAIGYWLLPARRAWALPLLLALGSPMLVVSKFIWSEPLFNWLWASYFFALFAWLRRGGWRLALLATVVGCLLPLQRVAGVFLLAGVGVGLFWPSTANLAKPSRLAQLGHLVGAASGLVVWQLHRSILGDSPASSTHLSLPEIMADYGFVVGRWLVPLSTTWLAVVPPAVWILLLLAVLLLVWPRASMGQRSSSPELGMWVMLVARMLFAGLVLTLGLLITSVLLQRASRGLQDTERFLTVLYAPVMLLVLLAWPSQGRWAARLGPGLLGACLLYQSIRVGHNAQRLYQLRPVELNYPHPTPVWATGSVLKYLDMNKTNSKK